MKKTLTLLILLFASANVFADCMGSHLSFWPTSNTVHENSIFVINNYVPDLEFISGNRENYKIYLKSGEQKINLIVQEALVGQYDLAQVILKPEHNLTVGLEYELVIEGPGTLGQMVYRVNYEKGKREAVKWKVISDEDTVAPAWISKAAFENDDYQMLGCGPEIYSYFKYSASDNSEFLVRTTVKNLDTGRETTFCLEADKNMISVGHGMCSGAFDLEKGEKFEVEFSLMDASGNVTGWNEARLIFTKPKAR